VIASLAPWRDRKILMRARNRDLHEGSALRRRTAGEGAADGCVARAGTGRGSPARHPDAYACRQYRRTDSAVIRCFKNTDTEKVWNREHVRSFGPELQRAAQKKLRLLNAASELDSLRVPPGNRLEKLVGDRAGQHSSASTTNIRSASSGPTPAQPTSRSPTTT